MSKRKNKKINKKLEKIFKKTFPKRIIVFSFFVFLCLCLLLVKISWINFVDGASYKERAYNQQTIDREISPKRGTIYDSTGKALATSASVDTVSINPKSISDKNKEAIARAFSDIFELDYDSVYSKVTSNSAFVFIAKKVENDKIAKLKEWMSVNKITRGINIDTDTKRYYPYNNLASNYIGFCGSDNSGRAGIEYKWDSVLTRNSR